MSELEKFLAAFDTEVAQQSIKPSKAAAAFLGSTAKRQRRGLVDFFETNGRLPATVGELLSSSFAVGRLQRFRYDPDPRKVALRDEWSVVTFLARTEAFVEDRAAAGDMTLRSLRLIHAVYGAADPIAGWKAAAETLLRRGFGEQLIEMIRTDHEVRRACRKLIRPFNR